MGTVGVAFGFISWCTKVTGVIVYTSLIGSYLIVRASAWYIGGFPNEWTLRNVYNPDTSRGIWSEYWKFYIYLVIIVIIAAIGIVI